MQATYCAPGLNISAGTLTLAEGSKSTVNGTVTADSLTAAGTAEGSGKITVKKGADVSGSLTAGTLTLEEGSVSDVTGSVTAEKTLVLGGDFTLGNIASLTAGTADFGGYSAMLVNTSGSAPTVLTMTGLSSSGTD